jgi:hypothetical protein
MGTREVEQALMEELGSRLMPQTGHTVYQGVPLTYLELVL